MRNVTAVRATLNSGLIGLLSAIAVAAVAESGELRYSIEITDVRAGSGDTPMSIIYGISSGSDLAKLSVVIYARTDQWYVQPTAAKPITAIRNDGTFKARIHPGDEYAVLLVDSSVYSPVATTRERPALGSGVLAIDFAIHSP